MRPRPRARYPWDSLRRSVAATATTQLAEVRSAISGLSRAQAALLVVGATTVAFGGLQLLQLLVSRTAPVLGVGAWWLGGPLLVDLVAVPIVVVIGLAIGRLVAESWRRYVAGASALTVLLGIVALPFLTGLGRRADNPSLLDRNYWGGFLTLVTAVWVLPLLVRLARWGLRSRRRPDRGVGRAGRLLQPGVQEGQVGDHSDGDDADDGQVG